MRLSSTAFVIGLALLAAAPALADDPGRIDAYVTPYYDSRGPVVKVGAFSHGLAASDQSAFVATILKMKQQWKNLSFIELYVGAIRLYDMGFRNEATYWFYSAQYAGRQFGLLVDQKKLGGIGSPGFELYHAQDAFFELAGPKVNGYAFGNIDTLTAIVRRVQGEHRTVGDVAGIYPGVAFTSKAQWNPINANLNSGLGALVAQLQSQKGEIAQERAQNGTQARFAQLTNKQFPGGL